MGLVFLLQAFLPTRSDIYSVPFDNRCFFSGPGTMAEIAGLEAHTSYAVRVRALNYQGKEGQKTGDVQ